MSTCAQNLICFKSKYLSFFSPRWVSRHGGFLATQGWTLVLRLITFEQLGTWKSETRKQFWPQTLLPKDCPTARILSFGYNADFAHFYPDDLKEISPELTIDNYSTALFQALIALRGTETVSHYLARGTFRGSRLTLWHL